MALQIWANPNLAPALTFEGAQGLGRGLGSGLSQLGSGLGAARAYAKAEEEKAKKEAQEAQSLRKLAELRGWADKDSLTSMGLGDLRGLHLGKSEQEASDLRNAQRQHMEASTKMQNWQLENQGKFGDFMDLMSTTEGEPDPATLMRAMSQSGYSPGPELDNLIRAFGSNSGGNFYPPNSAGRATPLTIGDTGEVIPGKYVTPLGPKQGQIIETPTTAGPQTYTDPKNGETFYWTGKRFSHIPIKKGLSDIKKIEARATIDAILNSPNMLGAKPEVRQKAVSQALKEFEEEPEAAPLAPPAAQPGAVVPPVAQPAPVATRVVRDPKKPGAFKIERFNPKTNAYE